MFFLFSKSLGFLGGFLVCFFLFNLVTIVTCVKKNYQHECSKHRHKFNLLVWLNDNLYGRPIRNIYKNHVLKIATGFQQYLDFNWPVFLYFAIKNGPKNKLHININLYFITYLGCGCFLNCLTLLRVANFLSSVCVTMALTTNLWYFTTFYISMYRCMQYKIN